MIFCILLEEYKNRICDGKEIVHYVIENKLHFPAKFIYYFLVQNQNKDAVYKLNIESYFSRNRTQNWLKLI